MTTNTTEAGHENVTEQPGSGKPSAKWAVLLNDGLFPMPRRRLRARDILDQCGITSEAMLQRDYGGAEDIVLPDSTTVDLAEGNVFRSIPPCEVTAARTARKSPPKLAFVLDDLWEVTLIPRQTGQSLKHLFGVPEDSELLRDFESPLDSSVQNEDIVLFSDGPVFTLKRVTLTITVNNKPVRFTHRRATALQIKEAAIAQHVNIEIAFVLFRIKPDGSISPAIPDSEIVKLKQGDAFRCVAADDTSWH